MKLIVKYINSIIGILSLLLVLGCDSKNEFSTLEERGVALNFAIDEGAVQENNSEGVEISIAFLAKTIEAGTIDIEVLPLNGLVYGTDFTTDPDASSGKFTLNVPAGATELSFTVFPANVIGEDDIKSIAFRLLSATGGVFVGTQQDFTLHITDEPIILITDDLTGFGDVEQGFPSASQSYTVSVVSLTDNLVVTAPDNYEVSADNTAFSSSLSLAASAFTDGETTIYVRMSPSSSATLGVSSGSIVHSATGASDKTQAVSGTIIAPIPAIIIDESLTDFGGASPGQQSARQSYTVEGHALSEDVVVTVPANFEVSTDTISFSSSATLNYTAIEGNPTNIYVRFVPTFIGTISETIVHNSTGAPSVNFTVTGTGEDPSVTIAYTSFEEPTGGTGYTDLETQELSHPLNNNVGDAPVDFTSTGGELGFDSNFVATRIFNSPNGLDNEPIGVLDGIPTGSPSPSSGLPTAFTDGNQGFGFGDTDGIIEVTFDSVDITGYTQVTLSLDMFIRNTSYEFSSSAPDRVRITAIVDGGTVLSIIDLEANETNAGMPNDLDIYSGLGMWTPITLDLSGFTSVQLVVEVDTNFNSEVVLIDNIQIKGLN
ncbi:MAG: hypothetical protein L3J20_09645 [Flavobacteriaceae bacterium]|nr:hypothetical protein [Flavobacteriaceae bacterium]